MDVAIREMHNGELDGRTISVNKAQPRMNSEDDMGVVVTHLVLEVDIVVQLT